MLSRRNFLFVAGAPIGALADTCPPAKVVNVSVGAKSRIPAHTVKADSELAQDIYAAYEQMAALCESDPRSLASQRKAHAQACVSHSSHNVHTSNDFVLWHRAFLYYHERILGSLISKPGLRIPYWAWDSSDPEHRKVPEFLRFAQFGQGVQKSMQRRCESVPLFYETNNWKFFPARLEAMKTNRKNMFEKLADEQMHKDPHGRFGDAVSPLETAAADPLFYAHHANLDRLVETVLIGNQQWPTASGEDYTFYDETAMPKHPSLSWYQKLSNLEYSYQPNTSGDAIPAQGYDFIPIGLNEVTNHNSVIGLQIKFKESLIPGSFPMFLESKKISDSVTLMDHSDPSQTLFLHASTLEGLDLQTAVVMVGKQYGKVEGAVLVIPKP